MTKEEALYMARKFLGDFVDEVFEQYETEEAWYVYLKCPQIRFPTTLSPVKINKKTGKVCLAEDDLPDNEDEEEPDR